VILVASIPRSGKTYLKRSIAGLPQGEFSPPSMPEHFGVGGTHRLVGNPRIPDATHTVFLFGDVAQSVASTRRNRYEPNHFANCGAAWPPAADLYDEDVLGYEAIWDSWYGSAPSTTLFVRYEALGRPDGRAAIERFLGRGVRWLPWRERTTTCSDADRRRIERAYRGLIEKVAKVPDVFLRGVSAWAA
jgi:hypothetical protein